MIAAHTQTALAPTTLRATATITTSKHGPGKRLPPLLDTFQPLCYTGPQIPYMAGAIYRTHLTGSSPFSIRPHWSAMDRQALSSIHGGEGFAMSRTYCDVGHRVFGSWVNLA